LTIEVIASKSALTIGVTGSTTGSMHAEIASMTGWISRVIA
jgi:hypothetical protein